MLLLRNKIAASNAQYAAARYEEIAEPPVGPPSWPDRLRQWETEMQALGYIRLLYYHNANYASLGRPNFTCVYVSPDRLVTVAFYLGLWPKASTHGIFLTANDRIELTEANGEEMHSILVSSTLMPSFDSKVRWLISTNQGDKGLSEMSYPPEFKILLRPYGCDSAVLYTAWHREQLGKGPWASRTQVPIASASEFLADERAQHQVLSAKKSWFSF
ncbi:hypothetical protein DB346_08860 [Verrucomicrobia bacterium LW23]|nr:hypothetical protein DB346_08860 [Verrucomicrobia bacterium LW23]